MKKLMIFVLLIICMVIVAPASAQDSEGGEEASGRGCGMPALHNMTGMEFGYSVRNMAESSPGAVADHVSGFHRESQSGQENGMPGGMPALHNMTGMEFGHAVGGLAESAPGAIADHISNFRGGNPP